MLFARREPARLTELARVALWPRRSWARSLKYVFLRIRRIGGSPHRVALGCAVGVLVSFTPYHGFHFLLAALLAWIVGGSILASALGTFAGNPITFPVIWVAAYNVGNAMLGEHGSFSASQLKNGFVGLWSGLSAMSGDMFQSAALLLWPLIKPMTVGGVSLGFVAGAICYWLVRHAVENR